jgi:hypothetical protein
MLKDKSFRFAFSLAFWPWRSVLDPFDGGFGYSDLATLSYKIETSAIPMGATPSVSLCFVPAYHLHCSYRRFL